jgi:hypothetical protein
MRQLANADDCRRMDREGAAGDDKSVWRCGGKVGAAGVVAAVVVIALAWKMRTWWPVAERPDGIAKYAVSIGGPILWGLLTIIIVLVARA